MLRSLGADSSLEESNTQFERWSPGAQNKKLSQRLFLTDFLACVLFWIRQHDKVTRDKLACSLEQFTGDDCTELSASFMLKQPQPPPSNSSSCSGARSDALSVGR